MPTAYTSRRVFVLIGFLTICILIAWAIRHAVGILSDGRVSSTGLNLVWIISFISLAWTNILAFFEKEVLVDSNQQVELNKLKVAVLVPVYNEDVGYLKACLKSLISQTRLPNAIHVVDDGSNNADYSEIIEWAKMNVKPIVDITWTRTPNGGKRHAQVVAMNLSPNADIFLTIDSDTILERRAIAEGLKPFIDPKVQSVAGVLLALNGDQNFLTRFISTWQTVWQIVDRSSQSVLGCVTVNSGPLALYRAETIRPYINGYLNETFCGKPVAFSDDSLLTTYALYHGKTVQQPSAYCFTAIPDNVNHHLRQYARWMRGSFIRSFWRFKYLRLNSYIYWLHLFKWFQLGLSTFVLFYIIAVGGFTSPQLLPYLIGIPIAISYAQSLRYFTIVRSDQSIWSMIINFLLAPVALLWLLTVLRVVRFYSYATVTNMKWGTRKTVETRLA